ncbi:MAG: ABC transporter ATP-binding protein [Lachnospiraceae bacterium]|uniref:ABC transporter ATP-binding protein n=1 Tax=uncultured Acetatifactor sp. TaxID=1671927 RepID=UPI002616E53D|nr:ABC transporter ATP-binding protein [uncultured Acetatifactor sp.]MCI8789338.1 ABC transporter ATP-binding protein [Lachnospiraceae bacterium]
MKRKKIGTKEGRNGEKCRMRRTLREDWKLFARGFGIICKTSPQYLAYNILFLIMNILSPYFALYMSAALVNELAGQCDGKRLAALAGITVLGQFAINAVKRMVLAARNAWMEVLQTQEELYLADRMHGMEYEHLENPEVTLLREKIFGAMNATSSGLMSLYWISGSLITNVVDLVASAALTFSMFRVVKGVEVSGFLAFANSYWCTVLLTGILLAHGFLTVRFTKERTEKEMKELSGVAESNAYLFQVMGMRGEDIMIFDLKKAMAKAHEKRVKAPWMVKWNRIAVRYGIIGILQGLIPDLAVFLVTAAKAFLGMFGIGNFVLYRGTVKRFIHAVSELVSELTRLRENNQYLEQVYQFLDLPDDMYHGTLAVEKRDDIDYEVEFRDVSFRYPGTDVWVLKHVDMKFKIGDKLAIVGENGSGKTTFIKLLCRLYDPTEGEILLNGINITRYRYDEYMSLFSVVFQDYQLFQFSLAANVSGALDYDGEKVRKCLIQAGFGDKLAQLEKGIDTVLGRDYENDGVDLSGGEEQKVALARALYKDAPFMVLDEPTAALDPLAEAAVYENFQRIVVDKTAVFISHRLSSCRFCDDVAVFHKGRLVQHGRHDDLVAQEGKYQELWSAQAQYYA